MRPVLELLDDYGVYYRHKFSGHRSLHVTLPAAVLPRGYRGKAASRLARKLLSWGRSQAHRLPKITRMPYSLNEDTGLVCLPIKRGELAAFRPWQANVHLVEVCDIWRDDVLAQAELDALVSALDGTDPSKVAMGKRFFAVDFATVTAQVRQQTRSLQGTGPIGAAWRQLAEGQALPEQTLLDALTSAEPDVRWLSAEAYLLNGTTLSEHGFSALLAQNEEYVQPSAIDILMRFEEDILPYLVQMFKQLERHPDQALRAAYLLTQSDSLRSRALEMLIQDADRSRDALIVSACLLGSMIGDWPSAFGLLQEMRVAQNLTARDLSFDPRSRRRLYQGAAQGHCRVDPHRRARCRRANRGHSQRSGAHSTLCRALPGLHRCDAGQACGHRGAGRCRGGGA